MPDSNYFVKLYGHLTDDTEAFSKSLSVVLGIDRETANRVLESVPVVIAKAKNKQAAVRLKEKLATIGATCLVESEYGADSELIPIPTDHAPVRNRIRREEDGGERLWFRIWTGLLVATVAFLCIFSVVGYVTTFSWISGRGPLSGAAEVSDKQSALSAESRAELVAEIGDKIHGLEKKLDGLSEIKLMTKEEIKSPRGPAATDPLEMRKRKQELGVVNLKISDVNKRIKELRRELDRIERSTD
jgi:hypothetical protein